MQTKNRVITAVLVGVATVALVLGVFAQAQGTTLTSGTIVQKTDSDTTYALAATAHLAALCFVDDDADGLVDLTEQVYLKLACPAAVAAGDIRLGPTNGGTIVKASESDFARTTIATPGADVAGFFDADGDGAWSSGDDLYIKTAALAPVGVGDVRVAVATKTSFSRVSGSDSDLNRVLLAVPAGGALGAEVFFNGDGSVAGGAGTYTTSDNVYYDMDGSGNPTVNDVRLTDLSTSVKGGSVVGKADIDTTYALAATAHLATLCFVDDDADGLVDLTEQVYLKLACPAAVAAGDIRLGPTNGGTIVKASDTDFARTTIATPGADAAGFFDADGDGAWSLGDDLYIKTAALAPVGVGDVRVAVATKTSFSRVSGSDSDLNRVLVAVPAGGALGAEVFFNGDGSVAGGAGTYTTSDAVYYDMDASGNPTVNDIRLTDLSSSSKGGSVVGKADVDTTYALLASAHLATLCFVDDDADGLVDLTEQVYLKLACPAAVAAGDIRLGPTNGGTIVKASESDFARTTIATPGADAAGFFDADGDGAWSLGDDLYIKTAALAPVGVGDIRVSVTGKTSFSRVSGSDSDLNRVLLAAPAGGALGAECFFNADGSFAGGAATYTTSDSVYYDMNNAGAACAAATPTVNDVRLTGLTGVAAAPTGGTTPPTGGTTPPTGGTTPPTGGTTPPTTAPPTTAPPTTMPPTTQPPATTPPTTSETRTPGFEVVAVLGAAAIAVAVVLRRKN